MDAFFASVEQRDAPELRGQPVIVGGQPNSRGVVAACSYEAREFGIHSAMSCARAYRLCPKAIFVPPRFEAYREVSDKIREIFWRYATDVEPLSLDEAYLDVSYTEDFNGSATRIAEAIRQAILAETNLIASAGVSYNKFLAKIASDMDKPDGLYVIEPEQGAAFVASLLIRKFHGIGPATEAKMHQLGIKTGQDLRDKTMLELSTYFGKSAGYYYHIARGIDHRPVRSTRVRKSLGKETTFSEDIMDIAVLLQHLNALTVVVSSRLSDLNLKPKTLTLKVKYADFKQVTRAQSQQGVIVDLAAMQALLPALLARTHAGKQAVRLIGITASGFRTSNNAEQQLGFNLEP